VNAEDALRTRRSVRGFKPDPVPRETVERILALAARAPSGSNIQPWKVRVVAGETKEAITRDILETRRNGDAGLEEEYHYYPVNWREPYLGRRRQLGWSLYGLLGIGKGDREASARQHDRNFAFFGAPVGLFFTMDRDLERGSWLDSGMFIQGVMIAARALGLDTCPQAAFGRYHSIIRRHLAIPDSEHFLCGMSLGWADPAEPANGLETERIPVADFTQFFGL
jgi:nitroreductase